MGDLTAHRGDLILIGDGGDHGHGRGDGVVRGRVNRVDLAHHGLDHLLDLAGAGGGVLDTFQAELIELFGGEVDLDLGI